MNDRLEEAFKDFEEKLAKLLEHLKPKEVKETEEPK